LQDSTFLATLIPRRTRAAIDRTTEAAALPAEGFSPQITAIGIRSARLACCRSRPARDVGVPTRARRFVAGSRPTVTGGNNGWEA